MARKGQECPGLREAEQSQQVRKGDPALLSTAEATWTVFYVVLVSPVPEGCGISGMRPPQGRGHEGRMRELGFSGLESRRLRGILALYRNT